MENNHDPDHLRVHLPQRRERRRIGTDLLFHLTTDPSGRAAAAAASCRGIPAAAGAGAFVVSAAGRGSRYHTDHHNGNLPRFFRNIARRCANCGKAEENEGGILSH